ncbi:DUF421 domain-containing protein [Pedobacter sp. SYP-B3415]|uniref:DUF421 domain-containing protein n=1 Tax=Pedobacter sp. SYP-B3415 TaxID=2496641 RepID=UPI00101D34A2|nr:DUF421 domain-containing protein [Pedobacter sp. SYP-B3415]
MQDKPEGWQSLLFGDQDWSFIPEIMLRTLVMYIVILASLRMLGKRGVRQLSVFELVVIISLGSAAGDPMFYKEVGLVTSLIVFIVIVSAYKITAYLTGKSKKVEAVLEGTPTCLIEDGMFAISNFAKESLAQDEFFAELRLRGVAHLGQVELAIIETSGSVSVFYFEDEDVRFGLPVLPELYKKQSREITTNAHYSCSFCGYTRLIGPAESCACPRCKKDTWVPAINKRRVS